MQILCGTHAALRLLEQRVFILVWSFEVESASKAHREHSSPLMLKCRQKDPGVINQMIPNTHVHNHDMMNGPRVIFFF